MNKELFYFNVDVSFTGVAGSQFEKPVMCYLTIKAEDGFEALSIAEDNCKKSEFMTPIIKRISEPYPINDSMYNL
jgi:hypothetical protein